MMGPAEVEAVDWLTDWKRGGRLMDEVRHSPKWNQSLALLWFEDDRVPDPEEKHADDEEYDELTLKPLDGVSQWPTNRRRRQLRNDSCRAGKDLGARRAETHGMERVGQ
jgi:hypothetical protein